MARDRVTLRQVAEATGFTANTVSRALKDLPVISAPTRALIQQKAREMGYQPNRAATMLRLGRTQTVALIVGYLVNPFFGMLYEHVCRAVKPLGYTVMLFSSRDDEESEIRAIQAAAAYGVDGMIIVPCQKSQHALEVLKGTNIPYVFLARELPHHPADCVLCDEEQAGYLAARHMLDAGHRKIMFMGFDNMLYSVDRRMQGFIRATKEAGLPEENIRLMESHVPHGSTLAQEHALLAEKLCREQGFTAAVAYCDMHARHLMAMLRQRGIRVPEKLSMVGFDDIDAISPSPQPICSASCDYQAMCRQAVELLHRRITQGPASPERIVLEACMICRDSCR